MLLKTKSIAITTLLLFSTIFISSCDDTNSLLNDETQVLNLNNPSETITESEIETIIQMREEEKLAYDVYVYLYNLYGLSVFNNISRSEQTHMDSVLSLIEYYNLDDPASDTMGVFNNQTLQGLYNVLIAQGEISLVEALKVGATIEDVDIYDLLEFSSETDNPAILSVYDNLTCGSRNHMRAFVSQIESYGDSYTPQFISQELFNDIINSNKELCNN